MRNFFVRNKYTVFTMGGTLVLRSVNKIFSGELQFGSYPTYCRQLLSIYLHTGYFRYFQPMKIVLTFKEHHCIILTRMQFLHIHHKIIEYTSQDIEYTSQDFEYTSQDIEHTSQDYRIYIT